MPKLDTTPDTAPTYLPEAPIAAPAVKKPRAKKPATDAKDKGLAAQLAIAEKKLAEQAESFQRGYDENVALKTEIRRLSERIQVLQTIIQNAANGAMVLQQSIVLAARKEA